MHALTYSMHTMIDKSKLRVTMTLDKDVVKKTNEYAAVQRSTMSSLVNRILAEKVGLIPSENEWGMKK